MRHIIQTSTCWFYICTCMYLILFCTKSPSSCDSFILHWSISSVSIRDFMSTFKVLNRPKQYVTYNEILNLKLLCFKSLQCLTYIVCHMSWFTNTGNLKIFILKSILASRKNYVSDMYPLWTTLKILILLCEINKFNVLIKYAIVCAQPNVT